MSVSSTSSASASTLRMAGLSSGLDTETLVEQMTLNTKISINSQQQLLDRLEWKQENYREVSKKIIAFQDQYLDILKADTCLSSSSLYTAKAATSSDSGVSASATASAAAATYKITNIFEKATAATFASNSSNGKEVDGIKVDFSNAVEGQSYSFKFTLDGTAKTVTFTGGADVSETKENVLSALEDAFTSMNFDVSDNGRLTTKRADNTYQNMIHSYSVSAADTDSADDLAALGLSGGMTNQLTGAKKLGDIAFTTELTGSSYCFSINGEEFTFTSDNTVNDVVSAVNKSDAGVKLEFNSMTGEFSLKSTTSGESSSLSVEQKAGNLLTAMFGKDDDGNDIIAASSGMGSEMLMEKGLTANSIYSKADFSSFANKSFNITVNGETKTITLWQYDANGSKNNFSTSSAVLSQLNHELEYQFGDNAPTVSLNTDKDSGTMTFSIVGANRDDEITIAATEDSSGASAKFVAALGFDSTNSSNAIDTNTKLSDLFEGVTWGGTLKFGDASENQITLTENTTLQELLDASTVGDKQYAEFTGGKLFLYGADGDDDAKVALSGIFGEGYNYPGVPPVECKAEATGTNAVIEVNGMTITSNTNSFTLAGTTMNIAGAETGESDITISTSNDTTKAFDAVKQFVTDYNALISDLYTTVKTSRPTSSDEYYEPLTDEQREEMSDKEIELWEEKAKTGLLYQDSTINKFLTDFRSAVSGGSRLGLSLSDIGIKVSSNYKDNGKLELDETALKTALEENPERISEIFTDETFGIATRMEKVIDRTVATTGAVKGTLITLAGLENTSTVNDNSISKQLEQYQNRIDALQERYESEQERYWSKFTILETLMSTYNSQSSYISSLFSSN